MACGGPRHDVSPPGALRPAYAAAPNEVNEAFWHACSGGQRRAAEYLFARGADLNWTPDYARQIPLDIANSVDTGRQALLTWLRDKGAKSSSLGDRKADRSDIGKYRDAPFTRESLPRHMRVQQLTLCLIRSAEPRPRRYSLCDGAGLTLHVMPSGSKRWRFRYRFAHRAKMLSLGLYPDVSSRPLATEQPTPETFWLSRCAVDIEEAFVTSAPQIFSGQQTCIRAA